MGRYRVTMLVVYEVETTPEKIESLRKSEVEMDRFLADCPTLKKQIRLEKLKDKQKNIFIGEFLPEDVLPYISKEETKREYKVGDKVYNIRMNSQRYFIFRESLCCAACGIKGTKMILEQNPADKAPHFNLYAEENNKLILMTKDHVQPKAYGGEDRHSNFQTMCSICNNLKGSANLTLDAISEMRQAFNGNKHLTRRKMRELLESIRKKFAAEHKHPYVSRYNRRRYLAERKSHTHLISNTDIHLWKLVDGTYVGRTIYESPLPGAEQIGCIKYGTELESIDHQGCKVFVSMDGLGRVSIYQGYLDILEEDVVIIDQAVS